MDVAMSVSMPVGLGGEATPTARPLSYTHRHTVTQTPTHFSSAVHRPAQCDGEDTATLAHEARDDAVEAGTLEVQGVALGAHAPLPGAEALKVLSGLWHRVRVELENHASCWGTPGPPMLMSRTTLGLAMQALR
jgi:hypothetical protein